MDIVMIIIATLSLIVNAMQLFNAMKKNKEIDKLNSEIYRLKSEQTNRQEHHGEGGNFIAGRDVNKYD